MKPNKRDVRCVIVGGAEIREYGFIRSQFRPDDYFVYCDSGLRHEGALGRRPDLIVGDFDSFAKPVTDTETIALPREKDDTDTFFAAKEAVRRGFEEFLLLGVIGGRLDHTLANLSILLYLDRLGKRGLIIDDFSEMEIVSSAPAFVSDSCAFFSLLCLDGTASGVNIKNARFPLQNGTVTGDFQYAVSNEVLPGMTAEVSVASGRLLLIRDRL